jgi:hypothetical protein
VPPDVTPGNANEEIKQEEEPGDQPANESPDAKLLDDVEIPSLIGSLKQEDNDENYAKALTEKGGANEELVEM